MTVKQPTAQQLASALAELRAIWSYYERVCELVRFLMGPSPETVMGSLLGQFEAAPLPISQPHETMATPGLQDAAWSKASRQQDGRPHYALILAQYELFPDEFSDDAWAAIRLRYQFGLSVEQIAAQHDRAPGSVYRALAKAKQRKDSLVERLRVKCGRAVVPPRESE